MLGRMLNGVIRFSLHQRVLVAALAAFLTLYGGWQILQLPIDVFPNLDRPRVVVMTEAPGLAPEEVEALITFPLETALNGATGVQTVRSASGVGLSVITVEFDWGTDIYNDRQIVAERMRLVAERLPEGIQPQLAPVSSIMGQIQIIGMWTEDSAPPREKPTSPMELRTLADWIVRQRLLTIPGVSQVFVMGGERKQFQVLVNPDALLRYGVSMHEVETALAESNANATGGYLDEQGPSELLVRSLGRIHTAEELRDVVVKMRDGRPVLIGQVARVIEGPQVKRGDSSAFVRNDQGQVAGGPAVMLTINKQPGADTREVTRQIAEALDDLKPGLPEDVRIAPALYQQKLFIDLAIANVTEALRDGGILVVVILFLFLLNLRTTLITLTAIPLSIVITGLVFAGFGLSINTMTLGGLAVAIGELVDDAIVDVENIFRRLKENARAEVPQPSLRVVFEASAEIRNSIVYGTAIVVLVFIPVFALSGMRPVVHAVGNRLHRVDPVLTTCFSHPDAGAVVLAAKRTGDRGRQVGARQLRAAVAETTGRRGDRRRRASTVDRSGRGAPGRARQCGGFDAARQRLSSSVRRRRRTGERRPAARHLARHVRAGRSQRAGAVARDRRHRHPGPPNRACGTR